MFDSNVTSEDIEFVELLKENERLKARVAELERDIREDMMWVNGRAEERIAIAAYLEKAAEEYDSDGYTAVRIEADNIKSGEHLKEDNE